MEELKQWRETLPEATKPSNKHKPDAKSNPGKKWQKKIASLVANKVDVELKKQEEPPTQSHKTETKPEPNDAEANVMSLVRKYVKQAKPKEPGKISLNAIVAVARNSTN